MPRTARASAGNICYHVLNRGNARQRVFHKDGDYGAFLKLLDEGNRRFDMRLIGFCLMPNHFHLVVWPRGDGDLSRYMHWLLTAHVRRYHRHYESSGHVWQGRFKAFPIQSDDHLFTVLRYVEQNPVRAKTLPVRIAQDWPWSSAGQPPNEFCRISVHQPPVPKPEPWLDWVNRPSSASEIDSTRECIKRGRPLGDIQWQKEMATQLGLESSLRPRGRPPKNKK